MINKHGPVHWLDVRIHGKRIRRSLRAGEHALAIERARDIQSQLLEARQRKDITIHEFSLKYLEWAWDSKPASADRETALLEKGVDFVRIGSILGHSKITTSLIYSHTDREKKRKAIELLEE